MIPFEVDQPPRIILAGLDVFFDELRPGLIGDDDIADFWAVAPKRDETIHLVFVQEDSRRHRLASDTPDAMLHLFKL